MRLIARTDDLFGVPKKVIIKHLIISVRQAFFHKNRQKNRSEVSAQSVQITFLLANLFIRRYSRNVFVD